MQTKESDHDLTDTAETAVQQLIEMNLVTEKQDSGQLNVTPLGKAVFKGKHDIELDVSQ